MAGDAGEWTSLQLIDLPEAVQRTTGPLPAGIRLRTVDLSADLERIADLYNTAFSLEGADVITSALVAQFTWHPGLHLAGAFLALYGQRVVGLGVGSVEVPVAGGRVRRGAVELLAVHPGHQRQGIGRALLHAVLGWLSGLGVSVVEASAQDAGPLTMLQRYGFVPVSPEQNREGAGPKKPEQQR